MKEYWINYYGQGVYGFAYSSIDACEDAAFHVYPKRLYRIHVRLK
jgi:hypothetical protein